jgi:hypothetical protein
MQRTGGTHELEQLFADTVHVDGKRDPAEADKSDT